ncbi:MAG TPA: hypothetical protein PJ982_08075 [Lacipirellulaceae bacterium]|nr:hypothetical protein [Lacipirellulaceae bacterium]
MKRLPKHLRRRPARRVRRGLAAIEVVLTTALVLPSLAFLLFLGFQVCRNYFSVVGAMTGSPF